MYKFVISMHVIVGFRTNALHGVFSATYEHTQ